MDNRAALAVVFQNLGVLHQTRAERASNPQDSNDSLLRAVSTIEESLAIKLENKHQVGAAASYFQLGVLQRMLEDPTRAEDYFRRSLEISESLSLPDTYKIYHNLAEVVELRGDSQAQSEWFAKYKAAAAEIQRRHRGDGQPASVPAQLTNSILALARVVYDVRSRGVSLPADVSEALAKLSSLPAPLGEVGPFLRQVADGESPPVPSDLPKEVTKILEALLQAVG